MQTSSSRRLLVVSSVLAALAMGSVAYAASSKYSAGPSILKTLAAKRGKPLSDAQKSAVNDAAVARRAALVAANTQFVQATAKATGLSEADTLAILDNTVVPAGETVGVFDDLVLPVGNASILDNTVRTK